MSGSSQLDNVQIAFGVDIFVRLARRLSEVRSHTFDKGNWHAKKQKQVGASNSLEIQRSGSSDWRALVLNRRNCRETVEKLSTVMPECE